MKKRKYRIPDKLPKLKRLPSVGDLVAVQDLDGEIYPVVVLSLIFDTTKKGRPTKKLLAINVLGGHTVYNCMYHDLKSLE
mgnify:CR=1 FL=1|tara:strand:- start:173 stop:412 length:240 start_codon:yes stop_codon:yes gene_type:complete